MLRDTDKLLIAALGCLDGQCAYFPEVNHEERMRLFLNNYVLNS